VSKKVLYDNDTMLDSVMVNRDDCDVYINTDNRIVVVNYDNGRGEKVDVTDIDGPYSFFEPHEKVLYKLYCYALARERSNRKI
jgi:hypothetical protein